jgi:hypothetical protein
MPQVVTDPDKPRPGRPRIHPVRDDLYKLVASRATVVVVEVKGDNVLCQYCSRGTRGAQIEFSMRWFLTWAEIMHKRRT